MKDPDQYVLNLYKAHENYINEIERTQGSYHYQDLYQRQNQIQIGQQTNWLKN